MEIKKEDQDTIAYLCEKKPQEAGSLVIESNYDLHRQLVERKSGKINLG